MDESGEPFCDKRSPGCVIMGTPLFGVSFILAPGWAPAMSKGYFRTYFSPKLINI